MSGIEKDHECCGHGHSGERVQQALREAERVCHRRGVRLTEIRRQVLELIWRTHGPVGAYTLLEELGQGGRPPGPPTVYRALDFLLEQGLVHRIEKLNAFVSCSYPLQPHVSQFFICSRCRSVIELCDAAIETAITGKARREGFIICRQVIEIEGFCRNCQEEKQ